MASAPRSAPSSVLLPPEPWDVGRRRELLAKLTTEQNVIADLEAELKKFHRDHGAVRDWRGNLGFSVRPEDWKELHAVYDALLRNLGRARDHHSKILAELAALPKEVPDARFVGGRRVE